LEAASAPRSARIRRLSLRQHDRDGPYNAWVDPILTDEWQLIGWKNVSEMTKFGMPGVFAHGTFDTWVAGLLDVHRSDSQRHQPLYENVRQWRRRHLDAHTVARRVRAHLVQTESAVAAAKWSQRNNNNYEQTALLVSLDYFNKNQKLFLKNFYLKSKRSIEKPKVEGPAAYVFPGDDRGRENSSCATARASSARL